MIFLNYVYLRWDEAKAVEACAGGINPLRSRVIIRLCLYGGLRNHEVKDAKIEDVDPVGGCIYVPHGHNNGPRYVAIDSETLRLLAVYVGARTSGPLILNDQGEPMNRYKVYYCVMRAGKKAGIQKRWNVSTRMMRHTFATTWLRRKGNIRLLQKQMGHSKLESTAFYLDWMPEEIKAEYSKLFEEHKDVFALSAVVLCDMECGGGGLSGT